MNPAADEFNRTERVTPTLQAQLDLIREVKSDPSWRDYKNVLWMVWFWAVIAYLTPSLFTGRWGFVFGSLGTVSIMMIISNVRHVRDQRRWELLLKIVRERDHVGV